MCSCRTLALFFCCKIRRSAQGGPWAGTDVCPGDFIPDWNIPRRPWSRLWVSGRQCGKRLNHEKTFQGLRKWRRKVRDEMQRELPVKRQTGEEINPDSAHVGRARDDLQMRGRSKARYKFASGEEFHIAIALKRLAAYRSGNYSNKTFQALSMFPETSESFYKNRLFFSLITESWYQKFEIEPWPLMLAQWLEQRPAHRRVSGSIPHQGHGPCHQSPGETLIFYTNGALYRDLGLSCVNRTLITFYLFMPRGLPKRT